MLAGILIDIRKTWDTLKKVVGVNKRMIRILLMHGQRLFSEGVKIIIESDPDLKVVGIFEDSTDVMEQLETTQPDIVLIDTETKAMNGIQTAAKIKENNPQIKVIFLLTSIKEEFILRGIYVGADGFLLQDLYPDTCRRVIHEVYRGETVLSGQVAKVLVRKIRELTKNKKNVLGLRLKNKGIDLTARELEVAYLVVQGKSNQRIAQVLKISEGTVKNYISDLYQKININRRKDAISYFKEILES